MKQHRLHTLGLFTGLIALIAIAAFPGIVSANVPSAQVPNDLKEAIRLKVEREGHQYAGLCEAIQQSEVASQYCASVLSLSDTEAEVTYGPVSSEPTAHIVFSRLNGMWAHAGGGPGEGEPSAVPSDLKAAVASFIASEGHQYAGLCAEINQGGTTVGQYCANVSDLTVTSASVHYGPVATNELTTVAFEKKSGMWAPAGGGLSDDAPSAVPADLQAAIASFIASKGHRYAGLCAEIDQDGTIIGQYCAGVSGLTAATASVHYGPVATNEITTVAFEKKNGTWAPKATVSSTATPRPPNTGTGLPGAGHSNANYGTVAVGVALLAGTFGLIAARPRRR